MGKFKNDKKSDVEEKPKVTSVQRLMDIINNRMDSGTRKPPSGRATLRFVMQR